VVQARLHREPTEPRDEPAAIGQVDLRGTRPDAEDGQRPAPRAVEAQREALGRGGGGSRRRGYGYRPRSVVASATRATATIIAAARGSPPSEEAIACTPAIASSMIRSSCAAISVSLQKKACMSWTHSK